MSETSYHHQRRHSLREPRTRQGPENGVGAERHCFGNKVSLITHGHIRRDTTLALEEILLKKVKVTTNKIFFLIELIQSSNNGMTCPLMDRQF